MKRTTKKLATKNTNATSDVDRVGNGLKSNLNNQKTKNNSANTEYKTIRLKRGGFMKLFFVALATLSFSAFAETQEVCVLNIYKTEIIATVDGKEMKGIRMNPDRIPLQVTSFPQDFVILNNADNDVLGFYKPFSPERAEYEEMLASKNLKENHLSVRVLKRYIYNKVYLNILSDKLRIDIPVVADQKIRLNIPMGKDIFLNCEN